MLRKIGSVTVLSSLGAFLNFVTTFMIVHSLGLGILGQLTVISSITGLASVIYTLLPPNYSMFKYQDDPEYKYILTSFFILATIPFIIILYILYKLNSFSGVGLGLVIYNGLTTMAFNYYDIIYQATNKLYRYFGQLLFQAVFKIIFIFGLTYVKYLHNIDTLIIALSTAQLVCLIPYMKDFYVNLNLKGNYFKKTILYIINSFPDLKHYYLNSIIKRVKDNIVIVLFNNILNKELIGLYTLFIKIASFVLSLTRSFEAFFSNRKNMEKYHESFNKKIILLGGIMQAVFIVIGVTYMKIYTKNYYSWEILFLSFLVYPYTRFIIVRLQLLGKYDNKEINISMLIYIIFVLICFVLCKVLNIASLLAILAVYFFSEIMNYAYLIYGAITKRKELRKSL